MVTQTEKKTLTLFGSGFIGKVHIAGYNALPLCYPDSDRMVVLQNLITSRPDTPAAHLFKNSANDLDRVENTDFADICTPNYVHEDELKKLIGRGYKNIYCEKPLTGSYESEASMSKLMSEKRITNQVALVYRFLPAIIRGKRIFDEGIIGSLTHFDCNLYHGSYLNALKPMSWKLRKSTSGGGVLVDLGIHAIDALSYTAGDIEAASGYVKTFISKRPNGNSTENVDVDDFAHLDLLVGGARGTLEVSRITAGADGSLNINLYGTKGSLKISSASPDYPLVYDGKSGSWQTASYYTFDDAENDIKNLWPSARSSLGTMQNMHTASIMCFVRRICGWQPSYLSPPAAPDSANTMKIIDAIYEKGYYKAL